MSDGMDGIGHRSSKSLFCANSTSLPDVFGKTVPDDKVKANKSLHVFHFM